MNARQERDVQRFFAHLQARIARERALSQFPGIRHTARQTALERADELARDARYLRACYSRKPVLVGEEHG